MTKDELLFGALVVAFALLVTAHVAIVAALAGRKPAWRSLVAFVAAPLAPFWAFRSGMHARGALWVASAIAYAVLRVLASR